MTTYKEQYAGGNTETADKGGGMRRAVTRCLAVLAIVGVASPEEARAGPIFGSIAETFALLGGGGITSSGETVVDGNVGAPTTTGFPPALITGGSIASTEATEAAHAEALAAYTFLGALAPTQILTGENLGERTLTPGIYFFSSSAQLTGNLILDAQGDDDAMFVFQIGSTLTTASGSSVSLEHGSPSNSVVWLVRSSATLGSYSSFIGSILAADSVSFNPFAEITCGRALAGIVSASGAVTMADANRVVINDGEHCIGGYAGVNTSAPPISIPEPMSGALLISGLAGLSLLTRRKLADRKI